MTWEEIRRAYPDQYVVVAEPECEPVAPRVNGRVIGHGRTRDEAYAGVAAQSRCDWAVVFTGRVRGGVYAFVEEFDRNTSSNSAISPATRSAAPGSARPSVSSVAIATG